MISHQHVFSTPVCSLLSPLSAIVLHHPPGINHGLLENPLFKRFLQLQTSIYMGFSPVWLPEITTVFVGCQIFRGVLLIDSQYPQSTGCIFCLFLWVLLVNPKLQRHQITRCHQAAGLRSCSTWAGARSLVVQATEDPVTRGFRWGKKHTDWWDTGWGPPVSFVGF